MKIRALVAACWEALRHQDFYPFGSDGWGFWFWFATREQFEELAATLEVETPPAGKEHERNDHDQDPKD